MVDKPTKILVIRLSSIGDILLSSPFIRQVKKHFPTAKIDYLIKDQFSELMRYNPHINRIHTIRVTKKAELKTLKQQLKNNGYHIIFDLHNNLRSNYLKRGIAAGSTHAIRKNKIKQLLLVSLKINCYGKIIAIPERYRQVAADYNLQDDSQGLELFWQSEHHDAALKKAQETGLPADDRYICMAPGAAHFTKRWPLDCFVRLCEIIKHTYQLKIVVLGGENDKKQGQYLAKDKKIIDLTGRLSLLESAVILSRAKAVVTNDTGLMHMATAVNIPVVALFGSTVREFGFFPYMGKSRVLENKKLSCRPCTHIGRKQCPKKHFECMQSISSNDVFDALNQLIQV